MHPQADSSVYLKVGVDGGNLGGAAGRHPGPDHLNGRVGGGLLQGHVSSAYLSVARQPGGAAACLLHWLDGQLHVVTDGCRRPE